MKKTLCLLLTLLMITACCSVPLAAQDQVGFDDVSGDRWYADAVSYCAQNGIMVGVSQDSFAPTLMLSRAMAVTAISGLLEAEVTLPSSSIFTDVFAQSWYAPYVSWACEAGIASGVGPALFAPEGLLERQQLALMLYKTAAFLGVATAADTALLSQFEDSAQIASWARSGMAWAVSVGLLEGYEGRVMPAAVADRAQLAQILMRFHTEIYLPATDDEAIDIGSGRRLVLEAELFDPDFTTAQYTLHKAEKGEKLFSFDAGYENSAVYHNISQMPDGSYRMYYKATDVYGSRRMCYIESEDGLCWTRPELDTQLYGGQTTNIVTPEGVSADNLFVFWDTNPSAPESERIKGLYGQWGDGLSWQLTEDGTRFNFWPDEQLIMGPPAETGGCFYDTLNTAHWNEALGCYVAFVRGFHSGDDYCLTKDFVGNNPMEVTRDIRVAFSDDFINWSTPVPLNYSTGLDWQMYANAVAPYYREKGLLIGMPTRYERESMSASPETDVFLMHSRDALNWQRSEQPWLYPENASGKWIYPQAGYPCVGIIGTGEDEMSFYMAEANADGVSELYRYVMRADGFASYSAGTVTTLPLVFEGDEMTVNCKTEGLGRFRVTVTDNEGNYIQSQWQSGDSPDLKVEFEPGALARFSGRTVRIGIVLNNCEIYSFNIE